MKYTLYLYPDCACCFRQEDHAIMWRVKPPKNYEWRPGIHHGNKRQLMATLWRNLDSSEDRAYEESAFDITDLEAFLAKANSEKGNEGNNGTCAQDLGK